MGVLLYTNFGFVKNGNFMQYKLWNKKKKRKKEKQILYAIIWEQYDIKIFIKILYFYINISWINNNNNYNNIRKYKNCK
jgi:hypothetical protein